MPETDDMRLVAEYAASHSEEAFATLVRRHVNLVYSAAFRQTGNSHKAEEITQAVFIILAQKAARLSPKAILTGWLYQTTRYTAASFLRGEARRQHREQESFMQSSLDDLPSEVPWERLAPFLEDAMARLGENERNAILLRFFEGKSAGEAALALGVTEPAVKKRVSRAVEKLRRFFVKRGVIVSAAMLAGAMGAHSVQAAPAQLAAAAAACKGTAVAVPTLTVIEGALKLMAWSKLKITVAVGVVVILTAGTASVVMPALRRARNAASIAPPDRVLNNAFNRVPFTGDQQARVAQLRATVWPEERRQAEQRIAARQAVDETVNATTVDLTPFINAKLTEAPLDWRGQNNDNLASLPKGIHIYGGVPFDVEGTIHLMGGWLEHYHKKYPAEVDKIPIGRKCAKIHVLHGAALVNADQYGTRIAKLVVHYGNGTERELDFVTGEQAFDWWLPLFTTGVAPRNRQTAPGTEQAWTGTNPHLKKWQPDESLVLYKSTFANPQPDLLVMSVDYVSAKTPTVPFMVGLTVE